MKTFARLVNALVSTNKTTQKLVAIERFLIEADSKDKLWLLALFTGRRPKRPVNTRLLREWAIEVTGIPEWLFLESYSSVGDLSETIALVLASPRHAIDRSLHDWMIRIATLGDQTEADKKAFVPKVFVPAIVLRHSQSPWAACDEYRITVQSDF